MVRRKEVPSCTSGRILLTLIHRPLNAAFVTDKSLRDTAFLEKIQTGGSTSAQIVPAQRILKGKSRSVPLFRFTTRGLSENVIKL